MRLTSQNGLIAMTVTAIALTGAFLQQRGAMFAAVLGGLQDLARARHHSGAAALVAIAPGGPIAHLAVQHCEKTM